MNAKTDSFDTFSLQAGMVIAFIPLGVLDHWCNPLQMQGWCDTGLGEVLTEHLQGFQTGTSFYLHSVCEDDHIPSLPA